MATVDMKTLTIGDTTYKPVDVEVRTELEALAEEVEGVKSDASAAKSSADKTAAALNEVKNSYVPWTGFNEVLDEANALIDQCVTEEELAGKGYLTQHQDLSAYAKKTDLPTVPTKVSAFENDKGYLTALPTHNHNAQYYTKDEVNAAIAEYVTDDELAAKGYLTAVPSEYVTETELAAKKYLTALPDHNHDARYYTRDEVDAGTDIIFNELTNSYVKKTELNAKGYQTAAQVNTLIKSYVDEALPGGSSRSVPDYWKSAVDAAIAKVKTIQDEGGADCVQFAAIGDLHWCDRASNNFGGNVGAIAAAVMDACDIPLFVALGDLAESGNAATEQQLLDDHTGAMEVLAPIGSDRLMVIRGNHDDVWGSYTSGGTTTYYTNKIAPAKIWNRMHRDQMQDLRRVTGGNGTYFYIDNTPQKTRFICLNSHYYNGAEVTAGTSKAMTAGYGAEQLAWLRDEALNIGDDWTAVIFQHVPPTAKAVNGETYYLSQLPDGAEFRSVIANTEADVAAIFCGHCHADAVVTDDLPCPIVTVTVAANIPYNANEGTRTQGTATETAVDFVSINKAAKTIKTTRLGIGSDRVISYGAEAIVTYTITSSLTNTTNSNSATVIEKGKPYTATIAAKDGYENLTVKVTMDGMDITSSAYSGGKVNIASVTGNVVITATATAAAAPEPETVPIVWKNGYNCGYSVGSACTESASASYIISEVIPVEYGKTYTVEFTSTVADFGFRWIGIDSSGKVTEADNRTSLGTGKKVVSWTPTNTNTVGLRFRGYSSNAATHQAATYLTIS